ncbi:Peptidase propeptide and YPEB domain-containing protein [Kandleria vitulina]|uniref:PepSY domain-containing protein n=1 Tax=Kandleria vitulina TaxID=1630 RepID=UPI00088E3418|nr:PepSY domain-containing protein [Kandleria vitulina]SDM03325.1 Peptidase propeptide and YPEB domain-containing protein [Kandleria vitulina]
MIKKLLIVSLMVIIATISFIVGRASITPIPSEEVKTENNKQSKMLSKEEVSNLLLKRLPSSTIISLEIDKEDGILIYEGELRHNNKIYEFKIDAYSGVIVELEEDD